MTRSTEAVTEDLDKILGTLQGLRTGFKLQRPLVEMKLGTAAAQLVDRVVNQVLDVHETIAVLIKDLDERTRELEEQQNKVVAAIGDVARVLA
jgi:hypothetical protein